MCDKGISLSVATCFHAFTASAVGSEIDMAVRYINNDPAYSAGPEIRVQTEVLRAELSLMGNKKRTCPFKPRNLKLSVTSFQTCTTFFLTKHKENVEWCFPLLPAIIMNGDCSF